jgi:precorrin-2 dehydrogenase/sirohydrochlorin ferrochelatase
MIPLAHDFTDETVLVVGGGTVGARRARRFAREADVVVVGPAFADAAFGGADLVEAAPTPDDVPALFDRYDPALAVAATDDAAVNDAVERVADERGVLSNRADRPGGRDAGRVAVPATVGDGPVTVSVSTGGRSPALAKFLRERIEADDEAVGAMAELTGDLRAELKAAGVDPEARRDAVRAVVRSAAVWKALGEGETNARHEAERVTRRQLEGERE